MTPEQAIDLVHAANSLDNFIQINPVTTDTWHQQLAGIDPQQAYQVLTQFYGNKEPSDRSSITPGYIRRKVKEHNERQAQARARKELATRDRPERNQNQIRGRVKNDPGLRKLFEEARLNELLRLERRGIINPKQQQILDYVRAHDKFPDDTN